MQQSALHRVQPAVVTFHVVVVLLRLAVLANHFDLRRDCSVIGRHRAAFAERAEVLARIKAERGGMTHGAGLHPAVQLAGEVLRTVRLAGIFNHLQPVLAGQPQDGIHVRHLTIQMDRDDRGDRPLVPFADETSGSIAAASLLQELLQTLDGDVIGVLVDVNEFRNRSDLRDRLGRGDKGIGYRHDDIARCDAARHIGKAKGIGSAVHGNGMRGVAKRSEGFFEVVDHGPAHKPCGEKGAAENGGQLFFQFNMGGDEIEEGDVI